MSALPNVTPAVPPVVAKPFVATDPRALNLMQGAMPAAPPDGSSEALRVAWARNANLPPIGVLGVPFDGAVQGRKGAAGGPAAIREAFRFYATHDATDGTELAGLRVKDHGDVVVQPDDTRGTHERARSAVQALVARGERPILLGGDHSLTFPHVAGLAEEVTGTIGIVVIDAHYDLRPVTDGLITSGTPFHRLLTEPTGPGGKPVVRGEHLVEIGLRPFANGPDLAAFAANNGVTVVTAAALRTQGVQAALQQTLAALEGVDHIWLSIDIDGVDQSHAPGCSAPTPGGLDPAELFAICRAVGADPRFAGMDLLETAPGLDPSGNTARVAAASVLHTLAGCVQVAP